MLTIKTDLENTNWLRYIVDQFAKINLAEFQINIVTTVDAGKNILPQEIVQKKDKIGFPTPIYNWLVGDLKEYVLGILTSQKARQRGCLKTQAIEKQINESRKFIDA